MHSPYKIDRYLKIAILNRASDLHFSSGEAVRLRVDGDLMPLEEGALSAHDVEAILMEFLTSEEKQRFHERRNLDKSYALEGVGNFRVNIFLMNRGMGAVLRAIPHKIPSMTDLGLPPTLAKLTEAGKGLILVTGPTGSGKSTTLASLINYINQNNAYHILTAEDPIEFVHQSMNSLVNQREIGNQCPTFADALKYALREDPDVILVGEMRDLETIGLALTAAETGHLVFGTLHTRGAGASVDRIIDSFPANQQAMIRTMLAESLSAVISQSLLKRADGQGRVAAYEILIVNHAISNLIREGKTFQIPTVMQTGRKEGMILMDQSILDLVTKGIVKAEEALAYMSNPDLLNPQLKRRPAVPTSSAAETAKPAFRSISLEDGSTAPRSVPARRETPAAPKPEPAPAPKWEAPVAPTPAVAETRWNPPMNQTPLINRDESPTQEQPRPLTLNDEDVEGAIDFGTEYRAEFEKEEPTDVTSLEGLVDSDPDGILNQERRDEDSKETMIMEIPKKPAAPASSPKFSPPAGSAAGKTLQAPPPPFPKRKTG